MYEINIFIIKSVCFMIKSFLKGYEAIQKFIPRLQFDCIAMYYLIVQLCIGRSYSAKRLWIRMEERCIMMDGQAQSNDHWLSTQCKELTHSLIMQQIHRKRICLEYQFVNMKEEVSIVESQESIKRCTTTYFAYMLII